MLRCANWKGPTLIRAENLTKKFGDKTAVDGVSFTVDGGEIYGLLGPNGAGKTTTLSMLSGLLVPDSGRITFEGIDLASDPLRCKRQLGIGPKERWRSSRPSSAGKRWSRSGAAFRRTRRGPPCPVCRRCG